MENFFIINLKKDDSIYWRLFHSVEYLATEIGSLNDKIYKCYINFLLAINYRHFQEKDIREAFQYIVETIQKHTVKIGDNYCVFKCHWKINKKIAKNIFFVFNRILNIRNNN